MLSHFKIIFVSCLSILQMWGREQIFLSDQTDKACRDYVFEVCLFLSDTFSRIIWGPGCEADGLQSLIFSFFEAHFGFAFCSFVVGLSFPTGGEELPGPRCSKRSPYQPVVRDHRRLQSLASDGTPQPCVLN